MANRGRLLLSSVVARLVARKRTNPDDDVTPFDALPRKERRRIDAERRRAARKRARSGGDDGGR